jgi:hypothetical protein
MVIFNFVKNQVVPGFTRRHNDLDRLVRELGPVFLELIRRASKNPRVLNWLSFLLVFVSLEAQTACRGWFVGLVKNRTKTNKRRSPRSRSRGLIDRDVWSWTPATAPNVDSRLIKRRSDRAGW